MEAKKIATRDGFGEAIVELGRENGNVLVVDIDIGKSCKTAAFRKELHGFLGLRFAAGHGCARCTGLVLVTARSGVGRSQGTGGSDGAAITSLRKRAGGSNGHQRDQGTLRLIKWCVVHS